MRVKYILNNARGEQVSLNNWDNDLFAYTPTGFGVTFTNTYSQYDNYFKSGNTKTNQGQMSANILFGQIGSQSYTTFSAFATFLAYQPLTLTYISPAGTWKRDARVNQVGKSEMGGGVLATDKLAESFTLDFINPWYNNKTGTYRTYTADSNLATYGKGFFNDLKDDQYNYIRHTSGSQVDGNTFPAILGGRYSTSPMATGAVTADGLKLTYTGNGSVEWYYSVADAYADISGTALKFGVPYTIGFDVKGTVPSVLLRVNSTKYTAKPINNTDWTHVSYTFTMADSTTTPGQFFIRINAVGTTGVSENGFTNGQVLQIRHLMLQDGSADTGWAPAPEDNTSVALRDYFYGYWGVKNENTTNAPYADEAVTDVTHL